MKFTVNVECSPEEARRFMGLPDVTPINDKLVEEMGKRMEKNLALMSGEALQAPAPLAASARLDRLEAEAVYILRELSFYKRPALMFSGGKDSAVLLHLAMKAFAPSKPPFALLQWQLV